jgi:hypothetical protein
MGRASVVRVAGALGAEVPTPDRAMIAAGSAALLICPGPAPRPSGEKEEGTSGGQGDGPLMPSSLLPRFCPRGFSPEREMGSR